MAETDVFERRLRTALDRHVAVGPTDFDALGFARTLAAREPRRHGLGLLLGWRRLALPRAAWALLLVALLAVLSAGALVVGSQLRQELPAVVPPVTPAFACPAGSTPDEPGPVDQARPVIGDGVAAMVFDSRAGRIVLLAQLLSGVQTWTFDVCTNTWTSMHPDREPALVGATHLTYDVDSGVTIAIDGDGLSTWVYDLEADTWTRQKVTPVVRNWRSLTWTYDPVSGVVFASDDADLWSYDVDTDLWAYVAEAPWPAGKASIAYDESVDRIVAYASHEMWLFDIRTGTWSTSGADTPEVVCGMGWPNPSIRYDEAAKRTVVSCNVSVAYDATADRWDHLTDDAGPFSVYDAVNQRFVGLAGHGVLAFDLATRERRVLVEPIAAQPAPSFR